MVFRLMVGHTESEREDCRDFERVEFGKESGREWGSSFEQLPRRLQTIQENMSERIRRQRQPIPSMSNQPHSTERTEDRRIRRTTDTTENMCTEKTLN
jgi:hypothetical protein